MTKNWTLVVHASKHLGNIEDELCAFVTGLNHHEYGDLVAACVKRFRDETKLNRRFTKDLRDFLMDLREIDCDGDGGSFSYIGHELNELWSVCCRGYSHETRLFLAREPTDEELTFLATRIRAFPDALRQIDNDPAYKKT